VRVQVNLALVDLNLISLVITAETFGPRNGGRRMMFRAVSRSIRRDDVRILTPVWDDFRICW
jgi:hypothetical protein